MTDILTLDLTGGGDDDLLVPFSRPQVNTHNLNNHNSFNNNNNTNNSSTKRQDRGFGRFFRRPSQQSLKNQNQQQKENEKAEENLPLQTTTFAFPKARVEQADIDDSSHYNDKEPQPQDDDGSSDDDEDSDDDEYETDDDDDKEEQKKEKSRSKQRKQRANALSKKQSTTTTTTTTTTQSLKRLDEWDPTDNPYYVPEEEEQSRRNWQPQGFGSVSTRELEDSRPKGWNALLNRFRGNGTRKHQQEENLQSMKVATEATKDEKTLAEQIAKAALVVLVPELYMDEEDGEDNLGMYRTICTTTDDEADASMMKKNHPTTTTTTSMSTSALHQEIKFLRTKVASLDKSFKSAQLEANSWKLRCEELKKELRQYRGQSDDDSSIDDSSNVVEGDDKDNDEEEEEEDDGIEEEWTGYDNIKEGNLLEMPTNSEQKMKKSEAEEEDIINTSDKKDTVTTDKDLLDLGEDEKEMIMMDNNKSTEEEPSLIDFTPEVTKNMIFDPLAPSSI